MTTRSRTRHAALATAAVAVGVAASVVLVQDDGGAATVAQGKRASVRQLPVHEVLHPGGIVTGGLVVDNLRAAAMTVRDVVLRPPGSDTCEATGVSLAPTIPPTPESPLEVPAGGSATLEWTAYMDGNGDQACQGATLTSQVLLDGVPAGTITLTAGTLDQPPPPTGGPTTSHAGGSALERDRRRRPGLGRRARRRRHGRLAARLRQLGGTPRPRAELHRHRPGPGTAYAYRVTLRTGHWHMTSRPSTAVRTQDRPAA